MSTFTYLPSYFIGYIIGHHLANGFRLRLDSWKDHLFWIAVAQTGFVLLNGVNGLYNAYRIIPHSMSFIQINFNRQLAVLSNAVIFVHFCSLKSLFGIQLSAYEDDGKPEAKVIKTDEKAKEEHAKPDDQQSYSFLYGLLRLSFSIYMSNYLLIRTEFFARKDLYTMDWYLTVKRMMATGVLVLVVGFLFHILVVAPFNSLRRIIFERKKSKLMNNKKSD